MAENKQNEYPNVPPLRFPEFSEPWERKKLSCFLYENKERNKTDFFSKEDVLSDGIKTDFRNIPKNLQQALSNLEEQQDANAISA